MVEVAPAELAVKRLGPLAAREALLDLARRDAAEVEIGGEARGAVPAERVVVVLVLADWPVEETVERARAASRLRWWLARPPAQAKGVQGGQAALGEPDGNAGISRGALSTSRRVTPSQFLKKG